MEVHFLEKREIGEEVDEVPQLIHEVPQLKLPFAPSDPSVRSIYRYQALLWITCLSAALEIEMKDCCSNG